MTRTPTRGRIDRLGTCLALLVVLVLGACGAAATTPVDPAEGVAIRNSTERTLEIVYERPDETTEPVVEIAAFEAIVVGELFVSRDALCRTGRLVALADGTEVASLYLVCKGQAWVIESPTADPTSSSASPES